MNNITVKQKSVSFGAAYKIQGSADILDEICWFLQRNKKKPEQNFDFLDIRLTKKSNSETDKVLHVGDYFRYSFDDNTNKVTDNLIDFFEQEASNDKNSNEARSRFLNLLLKNSSNDTEKILGHKDFARIQDEKAASMIEEHLMDLISIKRGKMEPFSELRNKENVDLFLTSNDKTFAEKKSVNMVEDSLSNAFRDMNFAEKAKLLLENLSQMRNSLSNGKPILNFKPSVVQNHMLHLNLAEIPVLKADDVLGGIKQGTFDIVTGSMRA